MLWSAIVCYGLLWFAMVYRFSITYKSYFVIFVQKIDFGLLWSAIVFYSLLWFALVNNIEKMNNFVKMRNFVNEQVCENEQVCKN